MRVFDACRFETLMPRRALHVAPREGEAPPEPGFSNGIRLGRSLALPD